MSTSGLPSSQACASASVELLEAAQRDVGEQRVAVAVMPVGRGRAHARPARGVGKGEAGRTFFGDQFERGAHQGFLQIAVVIAARAARHVLPHLMVNSFYIKAAACVDAGSSNRARDGVSRRKR